MSRPAAARAWLDSEGSPVYRMAAELLQDGRIVATATARFVEKQSMSWFEK